MNKASSVLIPLCLLAQFSANANTDEKSWYAGASIGSTGFDADFFEIGGTNSSFDKNDTGFKVYGGYQINQYFAVEMAYANLGELTVNHVL